MQSARTAYEPPTRKHGIGRLALSPQLRLAGDDGHGRGLGGGIGEYPTRLYEIHQTIRARLFLVSFLVASFGRALIGWVRDYHRE